MAEHPASVHASDAANAAALTWPTETDDSSVEAPKWIGPYQLIEPIGAGGMGIVYRARQTAPIVREVALKLIKLGMDTREVVARFNAERQTLAILDHPGIAKVFDAGASETGRPYFVMELVGNAEPITRYCDRHQLDTRVQLELFMTVCHAVQHAHYKGIVHRDLKPSNVLVSDLRPEGAAAKIIDFGIAKAIETGTDRQTLITQRFNGPVGTLAYMSPEQAAGSADIDTRTDVYSLGVILYELLTGAVPIEPPDGSTQTGATWAATLSESNPPAPSARLRSRGGGSSRMSRDLRGDLDWITLKAMNADRARRYGSASELAEDIRRYLHHEPISAARPSRLYRARKFVRRNRVLVIASACVLVAMLIGAVLATTGLVQARRALAREATARVDEARQRVEAQSSAQVADNVSRFLGDMLGSVDPDSARGKPVLVRDVLDLASKDLGGRFPTEPLVEASLHAIMGKTYHALGLFEQARVQARSAVDLRTRVRGTDHVETLEATNILALAEEGLGHRSEAEELYRGALARSRAALGPENASTLVAEDSLASFLIGSDRAAEAEPLERHVLEVRERTLGRLDPLTLLSMSNMASIHKSHGRLNESESLLRRAVEGYRQKFGDDFPMTLTTMNNLATTLLAMKRPGEAEPVLRQAVAHSERVLGEDHATTLIYANNLAMTLSELGKTAEAEAICREALRRRARSYPPNHPQTLVAIANFGRALEKSGKANEAAEQYAELYHRGLSADLATARKARYAAAYGLHLVKLRRFADAEAPLTDAKRLFEQADMPGDRRYQDVRAGLADVYQETGRSSEAAALRIAPALQPATTRASAATTPTKVAP